MFTQQHFWAIADTFRLTHPSQLPKRFGITPEEYGARIAQWANTVCTTADTFAADNPRFKVQKFLEACNPEGGAK